MQYFNEMQNNNNFKSIKSILSERYVKKGVFDKYAYEFIQIHLGVELFEKYLNTEDLNEEIFKRLISFCDDHQIVKNEFFEKFGSFISKCFFRDFNSYFPPDKNMISFLESIQPIIYKDVKQIYKNSNPPQITIKRLKKQNYILYYQSKRKMIALIKGILFGLADLYNEHIIINSVSVNHDSDTPVFEISFSCM